VTVELRTTTRKDQPAKRILDGFEKGCINVGEILELDCIWLETYVVSGSAEPFRE
jgi:hypothetical protein